MAKAKTKVKGIKKKSLFDHIQAVTSQQSPNYWNEISDDDKKTWSNFMVNRFLSMKPEWIDLVNEVQRYPPKWLYEIVAKHLQCSIREADDAVEMYEISAGGQAELADILGKYGIEQKVIRKLGLIS